MWLEVGFIVFIVSAYVYFLHQDTINGMVQNVYKLAAAGLTVAVVGTGVYYLYKNPEQVPELINKFLKKSNK
jgi:hypothetical protein